jgi:hypothetical protein
MARGVDACRIGISTAMIAMAALCPEIPRAGPKSALPANTPQHDHCLARTDLGDLIDGDADTPPSQHTSANNQRLGPITAPGEHQTLNHARTATIPVNPKPLTLAKPVIPIETRAAKPLPDPVNIKHAAIYKRNH